jgi:hypothetical protein
MFNYKELSLSYLILACTVVVFSAFSLWLYKDAEVNKFISYYHAYQNFVLTDQPEEVEKLRVKTLSEIADDKLDIVWLPLVEMEKDELQKLRLYLRILAGNPEDELTYANIGFLINNVLSGEEQSQKRFQFLASLQEIEGVNHDLLKQYNLTTDNVN